MITTSLQGDFAFHKHEMQQQVRRRSDRLMNYYLLFFAAGSIYFASFFNTWFMGVSVTSICLLAYYSVKYILRDSDFYQYVLSAVLGVFMALFIYQMHGMFEMHFFAFIGSAVLITYQNWKLQIPMFVVVAVHHIAFSALQNSGLEGVYFSQLPYFDLQTLLIHLSLTTVIYFTCGLWAYQLNKYQDTQIRYLIEIADFQKQAGLHEERKKNEDAIKAYNAELIKMNRELVESQETTEKALKEAERADKAKSIFLATMSHEIRTPMNGVISMSYLLDDTDLNEQQRLYNDTIKASGENLLVVLNDILDYSKIEAGSMDLESHDIDLRGAIEEVLDICNPAAAKKQLEIGYQITDDVPEHIMGDKTRLQQVMINLVGNAIKFTDEGEVFIHVSALAPAGERGDVTLKFSISDTGIGISDEKKQRLFKAFSQGDPSVTRRYGGTGLGLVISEKLVKLMNGEMSLESEPGKGSVFSFTVHTQTGSIPLTPKIQQNLSAFTGSKVLIVDDNLTSLTIMKTLMLKWGFVPITASGGFFALQILQQEPSIALMITDFNMPDMQGNQLVQRVNSIYPRLPVILLSSVFDTPGQQFPGCFVSVLTKPVKRHILAKHIADALQGKQKKPKELTIEQRLSSAFAERYPLRILVAEDNKINQRVMIQVLSRLGYAPHIAENGLEAVKMAHSSVYDVILMDVQMPEMDGMEATRIIRNASSQQPLIIALTANAMQGDREECLKAGMDDYISKPLKIEELVNKLEQFHQNAPYLKGDNQNAANF
ncbi:MAG: response regulator [Mucilaginibacter polytrichastri]|nr:response regulator [Mucilaginibacter polytrichastri]